MFSHSLKFRLGLVGLLAACLLCCLFIAKSSVSFLDLAGALKTLLNLFVYLLELV